MRKTVLVHGCDPTLLQTRQMVLRTLGIEVELVLGDAEALERVIDAKSIDLFILCSSLDSRMRQQDLRLAHAVKPGLKCLVIADSTDAAGFQAAEQEAVVRGLDGPEKFLHTVRDLIL